MPPEGSRLEKAGGMKLYPINKLADVNGAVVKKADVLANNDEQALGAAAEGDDCPVCELWSEGRKVGSVT